MGGDVEETFLKGFTISCHLALPPLSRYALHLFLDLQGVEHGLPHNTNATQLWLIANLPGACCIGFPAKSRDEGQAIER